ncbi:MAG: type VI secretion system baseplate subunit TssF, partial [Parachlamydia sp.]|nr:type VI secretion system baseplate subunit TssF [Parachlamydia sp.]
PLCIIFLYFKVAARQISIGKLHGAFQISSDTKIYQAYLEELQQLEKFRDSHAALYGDTPLETEDPYTKRLIESLAFFSARTRLQGTRTIVKIHQCLFRQYFPFLVNPLPAFAMLQLKPSIRYLEKVSFPAGTEMVFKTINDLKATFQTLDPITVFPLFMKRFDFERRADSGWRCLLEFSSPHICTDEMGSLRLYINHLNSFVSSLCVSFAMQYSLERVRVFYDIPETREEEGEDCAISFGNLAEDRKVFNHVVEQIRSLLHFPQQELFVNLEIPPAGRRWQNVTFCFDFSNKWPESLRLTRESFLPFVTPIVNLKQADADPIVHDGTKDSHPVLYPEPTHKYELHTISNVLEILSQGTRPLLPGILAIGGGTYDVDYFDKRLSILIPDAFKDPKIISVSALWTQPWFSNYVNDELQLQFTEAETFGLSVRLLGAIHRYENTLEDDPNFLIRVLSLKNQNNLSLNEIFFMMNAMKTLDRSYFDVIPDCVKELKINKKSNHKHVSTLLEYEFFLNELVGVKSELVVLFFKYLHELLNCWLANFEVETKVHFPQHKKPLIFKRGSRNELSILARDFFLS